MAKKRIAVILATLLVWLMLPGVAMGAQVSLNLSKNTAAVGDSITASGSADPNEWVSIKVLDSTGNIVFYDAVKSDAGGNYSCTLKVPPDSSGTLTVIAGYGSNVAKKPLVISEGGGTSPATPSTPSSGGSSSGGGSTVPAAQTIGSNGATISEDGAIISFPANAVSSNIKVAIKKLNTEIPSISAGFKLLGEVYEISSDRNTAFDKPVTITLPFERNKVDKDKHDVGIYCWSNNQWIILDQVKVDSVAGKVSGEVKHFSKFAVLAREKEKEPVNDVIAPVKAVLKDITGHWAEKSINELVALGAVSGYPDGSFKPNSTITRAEFATILVKAFKLEAGSGSVFTDTAQHWAKDSISTAAAHGIVSGYSLGSFGPNDLITREQMAVMISKAANLPEVEGKTFTDSAQIADWAKTAVASASGKNIISGYPDNSFRPQANANRAEAVSVIIKALNK